MVPHGVTQATTDADSVSYWWRSRPDANIGLATGTVVVIDTDPRHGGDRALAELENKHAKLPPTWHVATGGGGQHIYFAAPPRRAPIKNSVGQLGPGIDVRGLGGYVIAPPSRHISGQQYRWDCDPGRTLLCMLPPWLVALLDHPPAKAIPATEWRALVRDEITEGRRNDTIARSRRPSAAPLCRSARRARTAARLECDALQAAIGPRRRCPHRELDRWQGTQSEKLGMSNVDNIIKLAELAGKQTLITEDSAALAFAQKYRGELLFDHDAGTWFRWLGCLPVR